ncbi:MAG: HDOD domain-containing protein [Deltaproteobacteria bacterium]|jgi:HD-like signal output (HDOD) protein|nr:HDOD domain-containing protein [Deltaproteobacteria bacterium]
MTAKGTISRIEAKVNNLPLIDSAVVKIIALLNNPASNFDQIVERLSPDLTTRFLVIANSAYYGRKVHSIVYAVKLLGYSKMKDILITSILMDHFTKRLADFNFDRFMNQAQFSAAIAKVLGEILEFTRSDDLFTVASLQNIGKLVIAVYFKEQHKQIIALKKADGLSTREAEKQVLGISHGEIGAIVLRRFNVPQVICEAVEFHDTSDELFPGQTDSHLPYIARQAARIVGRFSLPKDMQPHELVERLSHTIREGNHMYREHVREEIRSKGYKEIFPQALDQAARLIERDLKKILPERTQ